MKKLFKIYNRLTDLSDHEYKFMIENKSPYLDKARKILSLLEEQEETQKINMRIIMINLMFSLLQKSYKNLKHEIRG